VRQASLASRGAVKSSHFVVPGDFDYNGFVDDDDAGALIFSVSR
jgi:hypothetical protein